MVDIFIPATTRPFNRGTSASIYLYFDSSIDSPNRPPPEFELVATNRRNTNELPTRTILYRGELIELQRFTNEALEGEDLQSDLSHYRQPNGAPYFNSTSELRSMARWGIDMKIPLWFPKGPFTLLYRGFVIGQPVTIQQDITIVDGDFAGPSIPQSGTTALEELGRRTSIRTYAPVPRQVISSSDMSTNRHIVLNNRSGFRQRYSVRPFMEYGGQESVVRRQLDSKNRVITTHYLDRRNLQYKTIVTHLDDVPHFNGKTFVGSTVLYRNPANPQYKSVGSRYNYKKPQLVNDMKNTQADPAYYHNNQNDNYDE